MNLLVVLLFVGVLLALLLRIRIIGFAIGLIAIAAVIRHFS